MPTSTELYKDAIFAHIKHVIRHIPRVNILDVGAGFGTYAKGLFPLQIDGIEVYQPYIDEYNLRSLYRNIFCEDILNFDYSNYDYIIIGDVIEHLNKEDAIRLVKDISDKKIKCLIGVPFNSHQTSKFTFLNKEWDVESEIHLQPDLTPRVMKSRFPSLEVLLMDDNLFYGYYTNYHTWNF